MSNVVIDVGQRHIRQINEDIQAACAAGQTITVHNTLSRHNLGIGLPAGASIAFEGSVGYYCGGLNNGATVTIERNAGWVWANPWPPVTLALVVTQACRAGPRCWAAPFMSKAMPGRAAGWP